MNDMCHRSQEATIAWQTRRCFESPVPAEISPHRQREHRIAKAADTTGELRGFSQLEPDTAGFELILLEWDRWVHTASLFPGTTALLEMEKIGRAPGWKFYTYESPEASVTEQCCM